MNDALRNGGCACIFDWDTLVPMDDPHGYYDKSGKVCLTFVCGRACFLVRAPDGRNRVILHSHIVVSEKEHGSLARCLFGPFCFFLPDVFFLSCFDPRHHDIIFILVLFDCSCRGYMAKVPLQNDRCCYTKQAISRKKSQQPISSGPGPL